MSKALLIDGFALLKVWAVGFFGFGISGVIHILPAVAIIVILISFLSAKTFLRRFMPFSSKPLVVKHKGKIEKNKRVLVSINTPIS